MLFISLETTSLKDRPAASAPFFCRTLNKTLLARPFCAITFLKPTASKPATTTPNGSFRAAFSASLTSANVGSFSISFVRASDTWLYICAVRCAQPPIPPIIAGNDSVKPSKAPPQKDCFVKSLYSLVVSSSPTVVTSPSRIAWSIPISSSSAPAN